MKKSLALVAAATALALGVSACSSSGSSSTKVSIMVGGLDKQIYLPFMLAQKLDLAKSEGLTITLSDEPAGVNAETAMVAGQVNGVGGFYDHNIDLQAKGKSTEAVVSMLQVPGEVELCRSDLKGTVKSPADWKGRSLGITDKGSSTDFLTQYLAQKNGVAPTDIHEIGVQAGPTFIAAMDHKSIDCGMTTEPTVSNLLDAGKAYIIADTRTAAGARAAFGSTYPATSLYMKTTYVNAHKATVQKLVNVYVKTLKWINTHSAAQITDKMPPDYYAGVGKANYVKALAGEKGMYNPTGLMPSDGPKACLAVLQANADVKGKSIDLAKTFTNTFAAAAQKA
ncbi:MAG: ABC transporter substrate-binding protein [Actinomycetota bacterium]|nr:ABC transporter substrate-binding protein [Actinomycetota bacterium]